MIWLETTTWEEARQRRSAMWGMVNTESLDRGVVAIAGGVGLYEGERFWADAIRDTYNDPPARLAMAKRNLPLPAAFREAAVALRALIRRRRKAEEPCDEELLELHRLAAIASLANYDELDVTPFGDISALDLSPANLGWNDLRLLNVTDRKLMASSWPVPRRHASGIRMFPQIAQSGALELRRQRETRDEKWLGVVEARPDPIKPAFAPQGWFARIFGRLS